MIYGMYLSATGVMTNTYRQDVIANNLANAQTAGFKRDLSLFRQRPTADVEQIDKAGWGSSLLDGVGGGTYAMPTAIDTSNGPMEDTGNSLDVAIQGSGYFSVQDGNGNQRLTRNGQFAIDNTGALVLANGQGQRVLDTAGKPILLDPTARGTTYIAQDGTINQANQPVARLGVFNVPDPAKLKKEGGTLFSGVDSADLQTSNSPVRSEVIEDANVDPATEMAQLMDAQRQLEANANMIRTQDQTLDKLVNSVGKIS
jgi:flagellar basal-body rod protein FlgF